MDEQFRESLGQLDQTVAEAADFFSGQADREADSGQPWGAREVLAHFLFWHERTCINAERVLAGQAPEALAGQVDESNAAAVAKQRGQSIGQMAANLIALQGRLSRSYRQLDDPNAIVMVRADGTTFTPTQRMEQMTNHYRGHLAELRG